ncbi:beta-3 adrenergic receptor-like [Patiria miniata]|uniref:G-protein coupled receptors family 1 profile domain-containing protein n=1 Tax=Patiria miniata TaxID=46514 RepID=A0A914AMX4_PATMI|nr:beta-3 adrenergic receptor-like [Patiria miniata]
MPNVTPADDEGSVASVYDSYGEKQLLAALYGLISFAGVIGNSAVVLAPILSRKPRTTTNVFVINLAVADLLTCLSLPIMILAVLGESKEKLLIPPPLCAVQGFLFVVCIGCSVNSIASIAIYRALITRRTNQSRRIWLFNRRGLAATVAMNWLVPVAFSILPISSLAGSYEYNTNLNTCSFNPTAQGSGTFSKITVTLFALQLVVVFASSAFIVFSVRKHIERVNVIPQQPIAFAGAVMRLPGRQPGTHGEGHPSAHQHPRNRHRRTFRRSLDVTFTLFLVVFCFMVCCTPYLVAAVALKGNAQKHLPFLAALLITNSCINPVIYTARHPDFKEVCRCIMLCRLSEIPRKSSFLRNLLRFRERRS